MHFLLFQQGSSKVFCFNVFNSLPNDKILDMIKLKAFADDKLNVTEMKISLYDRVENTVRKGKNAGNQHFLLFPQCLLKPSSLGLLSRDCVLKN